MSTFVRVVPVELIAGKEYVLRNGRHVTVRDNPHWQCAARFPFFVMQGPDYIRYFTPTGEADPAGGENEDDIVRPVYKDGEVYLDRNGVRRVIDLDDNSSTYPLEDEDRDESWTRDGRVSHCTSSARDDDLMDYEHPRPLPVFNPVGGIPIPPPAPVEPLVGKRATLVIVDEVVPVAPSRVGMRVEVQLDCATVLQGFIRHEDGDGTCAVEFDEGAEWIGFHNCGPHIPSGRGWWCCNDTIRAVSEAEVTTEAERSEALNEVDVSEVWAAYRINPSIAIESWIEARRVLKAAAK